MSHLNKSKDMILRHHFGNQRTISTQVRVFKCLVLNVHIACMYVSGNKCTEASKV